MCWVDKFTTTTSSIFYFCQGTAALPAVNLMGWWPDHKPDGGAGVDSKEEEEAAKDRTRAISQWTRFVHDKKRLGAQYPAHFPDEFKRQEKWKNVMKPIEVGLNNRWEDVVTEIIDTPAHKYVEVRALIACYLTW
jgi:hypothetical protein